MRKHTLVYESEIYNVWLIEWPPGSGLDWHDHGDSEAEITLLEGVLMEETRSNGYSWHRWWQTLGEHYHTPPRVEHRVTNEQPVKAVTLHRYSPPLNVEYPEALEIG